MGFADVGRTNEEHFGALADKVTGGQFVDVLARDAGVKPPVKILQRFERLELQ
jgi:hypothetical protein